MQGQNRMQRLAEMQAKCAMGQPVAEGRMTALQRLATLFDANSMTVLDSYVVLQDQPDSVGAGVAIAAGRIDGRTVYAAAQDTTVLAGAMTYTQAKKIARAMDLAAMNGAPFFSILDSAGLRLSEGAAGMDAYALLLNKRAALSGVVPQISIIVGPCAGSMGFFPAMGDIIIMTEDARLASAGTQVLQAAGGAGETVGNAAMHAESTGLATLTATTEAAALQKAREILSFLPDNNLAEPPVGVTEDSPARQIPDLDILADNSTYDDVREVLAAVVDAGAFVECSAKYATQMVTAFAHIDGRPVGLLATQRAAGKLGGEACRKAARFVRLCDAFAIPVVTFVDSDGFVVDDGEEKAGLLGRGAALAFAFAQAATPKITVIIGRAIGSAYTLLGSRSLGADCVLAWPNAEIAPMSADASVAIFGAADIAASADPIAARAAYAEQYRNQFSDPWTAAGQGVVDDVIAPSATRSAISAQLCLLADKRVTRAARRHGNAPVL